MNTALQNNFLIALLTSLSILFVLTSAHVPALHWLSFFWILPFAFLLPKLQLKQALIVGTLWANLFWLSSAYWLVAANLYFAKSTLAIVIIVYLVFCFWQALPYVILVGSYSYFNWKDSPLGPIFSASLLSITWALLPSPLPWIPQHSLSVYPKFIAVLDVSGISLLLFLSTLFCFSIAYSLRKGVAYKKHYIGVIIAIPVIMLSYGELRQLQLDSDKANASAEQWLEIGYVQPVLDYADSFDLTYQLTERLIQERKPDLIVWPEITLPYSFINNQEDRTKTQRLVNQYDQDIIVISGYVYTGEKAPSGRRTYYNQAQLIKDRSFQASYSKEILVPFFEYIPSTVSFLKRWMPNILYYQAGQNQEPLNYKNNIKLAMAICYEIIFPEYIRKKVENGGNIIINPSSDAIFKGGDGHYYHLTTAYFRSIENRVPWVRATNTGVSLIVDADGRMLSQPSEIGEVKIDSAKVFIPKKASLYSRTGDWFIILLIAIWLLFFAFRKS